MKKIAVPKIKPATTHAETGEDEEQRVADKITADLGQRTKASFNYSQH